MAAASARFVPSIRLLFRVQSPSLPPSLPPSLAYSSPPMQLTRGADESKAKTNGLAEFIAQEEMDRFSGFWWSDDSSSLAYCGVDESSIPPYPITHQALDTQATHTSALEVHRYPFAGEKNARVRLYVLNLGGREGGGEGDGREGG